MQSYDVVVVGAGIIGLCTAWQLARRSSLKILVLEKGAAVGEGSTGASSAVCRYRYSRDEMVYLARDGINAYRHWAEFTGLASPCASFHADGVLWLTGQDSSWAEQQHRRMATLGIRTAVLDDRELAQRYPAFSTCTLAPDLVTGEAHDCVGGGRHFLELDGGYMDPVDCAADLARACMQQGVDIRFNAAVQAVQRGGQQVEGVRLPGGEFVSSELVINAAGPWCNGLNESVGLQLPWPLVPTRIQILYLDRPAELTGHIPVSVDMASGIYFRTQNRGQQLVVGSILEDDEREVIADPDDFNRQPDDTFLHAKLHALHHRLPAMPYRGKVRGYCGLYTVNQEDVHPLVGPTEVGGYLVANGFSGHGFKLAPAIGSMLARHITGQHLDFDTDIPMAFFAVDRSPIELVNKSVLA